MNDIKRNMHWKHVILIAILLFNHLLAGAQTIRQTKSDFSDFIPLLKDAGFEVFSYDISSLKDRTYSISLEVMEYSYGDLINTKDDRYSTATINNRLMLGALPDEKRNAVTESNDAYDAGKGIYRLAEKLSLGFSPKQDSLKNVRLIAEDMGMTSCTLRLKPMTAPGYQGEYLYEFLSFKLDKIRIGGFTPLVLLGSYWYDKPFKMVRFYGDDDLSADLTSPSLKNIPHYYVIGIRVEQVYKTYEAFGTQQQQTRISVPERR